MDTQELDRQAQLLALPTEDDDQAKEETAENKQATEAIGLKWAFTCQKYGQLVLSSYEDCPAGK